MKMRKKEFRVRNIFIELLILVAHIKKSFTIIHPF